MSESRSGDSAPCSPRHALEGLDELRGRFNTKKFRSKLRRSSLLERTMRHLSPFRWFKPQSERLPGFTANDMLVHSVETIPTSLLKMKDDDTQRAIEMFKHIRSWECLTSGPLHKRERDKYLQKIRRIGESSRTMRDELYMQLLKQTRGNPDETLEKNAFMLFSIIATDLPCSEEIKEVVLLYSKSVALDRHEYLLVRKMATQIFNAVAENLCPADRTVYGRPMRTNFFFKCDVRLLDGTCAELVYDADTIVKDAIPQLAWAVGLCDYDTFALFERRGAGEFLLDKKSRISIILNQADTLCNGSERLIMKKEVFKANEEAKKDPRHVQLAFTQAQHIYLNREDIISGSDVENTVFLQLLACHDQEIFKDEAGLTQAVQQFTPKAAVDIDQSELVQKVKSLFCKEGFITVDAAQRQFLETMHSLPYGNCFFFPVEVDENFPIPQSRGTEELLLAVNGKGVFFFQKSPRRCVLSVEFDHIILCKPKNWTVLFKARGPTCRCSFWMGKCEVESICRAIKIHKRDLRWRRESLKRFHPSRTQADVEVSSLTSSRKSTTASLPSNNSDQGLEAKRDLEVGRQALREHLSYPIGPKTNPQSHSRNGDQGESSQCTYSQSASGLRTPHLLKAPNQSGPDAHRNSRDLVFSQNMSELREGSLIKNKYTVTTCHVDGKPNLYFAVDKSSNTEYFMQFFTDRDLFKRAAAHYELLKSSKVCKLIDVIDDEKDLPPCLVLEKASFSLKQLMGKEEFSLVDIMSILRQILEAVASVHAADMILCDLEPSNICWFQSNCSLGRSCKLVGLHNASNTSEDALLKYTLEYAAPEVLIAEEKGLTSAVLSKSVDIWAYGALVVKLLSGASIYGEEASTDFIRRCLCSDGPLPTFSLTNDKAREFVARLLKKDPRERPTASQALQDAFFVSEPSQQFVEQLSRMEHTQDRNLQLSDNINEEAIVANLTVMVAVEEFTDPQDASVLFHARKGDDVIFMIDNKISDKPIYMLNLTEDYRLGIIFQHKHFNRPPFEKITYVKARPIDSDATDLSMVQNVSDQGNEVMVLLETGKCQSNKLESVSHLWGDVKDKYVAIDLLFGVALDSSAKNSIELKFRIYCQMVAANDKLRIRRLGRSISRWWGRTPQVVKEGVSGAATVYNVVKAGIPLS